MANKRSHIHGISNNPNAYYALARPMAIASIPNNKNMTTAQITRYVRYTSAGETSFGILENAAIQELDGDLFQDPKPTGRTMPLADVALELPLDPLKISKVIGVTGQWPPAGTARRFIPHPRIFAKLTTSLILDGADVEVPPECQHVHHEGEMVVVLGKKGRHISAADAPGYVFGITVGNDVADATWYRETAGIEAPARVIGKGIDTWGPIYSQIVSGLDYNNLQLTTRVNGKEAARGHTSEMNSSVARIVSYLSRYATILPGDLIYMGNTVFDPDLRELKPGDIMEVELEGVGTITNKLVEMKGALPFPTGE